MISYLISSLITSASLFYSDSFLYSKFNCSSIHIQLYFSSRMHTHVYTYIHTYIHRLTYTHAQTHTDINTDTHPHPHPHTCSQSSGGIESILRSRGSSIPGPRPSLRYSRTDRTEGRFVMSKVLHLPGIVMAVSHSVFNHATAYNHHDVYLHPSREGGGGLGDCVFDDKYAYLRSRKMSSKCNLELRDRTSTRLNSSHRR